MQTFWLAIAAFLTVQVSEARAAGDVCLGPDLRKGLCLNEECRVYVQVMKTYFRPGTYRMDDNRTSKCVWPME
jgi:hypothetical protein